LQVKEEEEGKKEIVVIDDSRAKIINMAH